MICTFVFQLVVARILSVDSARRFQTPGPFTCNYRPKNSGVKIQIVDTWEYKAKGVVTTA